MKFLLSICVILLSLPALAGDFFVLDMGDVHMRSNTGADTIKLKKALKQQYPGVKLKGADLLSVMMVAKTKKGKGKAHLLIGQSAGAQQSVGGSPFAFVQDSESSFDRILFEHSGASAGRWQMKLRGNFIIRQVVVEIDANAMVHQAMNYNHLHIRTGQGGQDTLTLRAFAKQNYGLITQDYDLEAVTLVAKSKHGKGKAQLKVGQQLSSPEILAGEPFDFQYNEQWSYSQVRIENPKADSNGVWQIKLKGNIKVKEVILHMKKK